MKSKSSIRQQDALAIPEGYYVEPYTPQSGRIISPSIGKPLLIAKVHLNADATINGKDSQGNVITGMACSKGQIPFLLTELSSTGGISCYIIHDGKIYTTSQEDFTSPIY